MPKVLMPLLALAVAILAVALFLQGGQLMYAIVSTNSSASTVNLSNSLPTVEAVACTDSATGAADTTVDLLGGTYETVLCNATVNDINGGQDFNTTVPKGVFFENPDKTIATCTQTLGYSNVNCYVNNSCAWLARKNDTAQYVECRWRVWFNAKNTTESADIWYGHINVTDVKLGLAAANDSIEMADLLAVGTDTVIAFGAKIAGTNDTQVGTGCGAGCDGGIYNYGNVQFDIMVNGSSMVCSGGVGGTIPAGYIHANISDNAVYNWSYALTGTPSNSRAAFAAWDQLPNLTATNQTPTPTTDIIYLGIGIPLGVNGNCQSLMWFTAVQG